MDIVSLPTVLLEEEAIDFRWDNSPFKNLKKMGAKQKGKRFEMIVKHLLNGNDRSNTDNDMVLSSDMIGSHEIKGSTVTKGYDDHFSFLQIRPLQSYDFLTLACFYFDGRIDIYTIPKGDVVQMINDNVFKKQHEGGKGKGSTYCYNGNMNLFKKYLFREYKVNNG
jgi:hypothetical protein